MDPDGYCGDLRSLYKKYITYIKGDVRLPRRWNPGGIFQVWRQAKNCSSRCGKGKSTSILSPTKARISETSSFNSNSIHEDIPLAHAANKNNDLMRPRLIPALPGQHELRCACTDYVAVLQTYRRNRHIVDIGPIVARNVRQSAPNRIGIQHEMKSGHIWIS